MIKIINNESETEGIKMAIERKFNPERLENYFPGFVFSRRMLIFMVGVIDLDVNVLLNDIHSMKRLIARYLMVNKSEQSCSEQLRVISLYLQQPVFDDSQIAQFKETSMRNWMMKKQLPEIVRRARIPSWHYERRAVRSFPPKDQFIYFLDRSSVAEMEKELIATDVIKSIVAEEERYDYLKWLDVEEARVVAAYDFLKKNGPKGPSYFHQADDVRKYFIENLKGDAESKLLFLKMRAFYSNRKSRGRAIKIQCNFVISKKADDNIDKVAKKYGITRSQVIDNFFGEEFLKNYPGVYLESIKL